jgi:hypothetical protein
LLLIKLISEIKYTPRQKDFSLQKVKYRKDLGILLLDFGHHVIGPYLSLVGVASEPDWFVAGVEPLPVQNEGRII